MKKNNFANINYNNDEYLKLYENKFFNVEELNKIRISGLNVINKI